MAYGQNISSCNPLKEELKGYVHITFNGVKHDEKEVLILNVKENTIRLSVVIIFPLMKWMDFHDYHLPFVI